ncbi:MAG: hypothetical protein RL198_279 [Actinomycetota bacterium]
MKRPIVGVVGGGQLARMMIPAAVTLGIELRVLAETRQAPAELAVTQIGNVNDIVELRSFVKGLDVLTFEHEHVPQPVLGELLQEGCNIQPPPMALRAAQNKWHMRQRMSELNLPNPVWTAAKNATEVDDFVRSQGGVAIAKTPIGGYDGRGVRVISSPADVADWLARIDELGGQLLLEERISFRRELAALLARSPSGEISHWPLIETRQANGVCNVAIAPAPQPAPSAQAKDIAERVAQGLGVTGVLAVEMFEDHSGRLYINELAMRPHNSGHFSIEASETSQFEQHLRAVLDLPLGSTELKSEHAVMQNLLGASEATDLQGRAAQALDLFPAIKFHDYCKPPRSGRKLGHLTRSGDNLDLILSELEQARAIFID